MAPSGRRAAANRSPGVVLIPVLAVAFGIAAVLLSGTLAPGPASSPLIGPGGGLLHAITFEDAGFFVVALVGAWLLFAVFGRIQRLADPAPAGLLMVALAVFLIVIAFLVVVHLFVHDAAVYGTPPGARGPGSGPGTNGSLPNSPFNVNNTTGPVTTSPIPWPASWPWWVPYAALGLVGIAIGAFAVPIALARRPEPLPLRAHARPVLPEAALHAAIATLDEGGQGDPRGAIIAMYARLLHAVGNRLASIETQTARELARALVDGLGVHAEVAQELTDRFEEARYSARPLRTDAVERTREALGRALADLTHSRSGDRT